MPFLADERFAQGPEPPKATTRTRLARNGGASRKEPEVEDPVENETEEVDASTVMKKLMKKLMITLVILSICGIYSISTTYY